MEYATSRHERFPAVIVPALASAGTVACSVLIGLLDPADVLPALALVVTVILMIGVSGYAAIRWARHTFAEQNTYQAAALDDFVRHLVSYLADLAATTGAVESGSFALLEKDRVFAIEKAAHEVWISTLDLEWEANDAAVLEMVREGLATGIRYRYLVHDTAQVRSRIRSMMSTFRQTVPPAQLFEVLDCIEFRALHTDWSADLDPVLCTTIYVTHQAGEPDGYKVVSFPPADSGMYLMINDYLARRFIERFEMTWHSSSYAVDPAEDTPAAAPTADRGEPSGIVGDTAICASSVTATSNSSSR